MPGKQPVTEQVFDDGIDDAEEKAWAASKPALTVRQETARRQPSMQGGQPAIPKDARVEVLGLSAKPEHNGKVGRAVSYDHKKERVVVDLDTGGRLLLRLANLRLTQPAQRRRRCLLGCSPNPARYPQRRTGLLPSRQQRWDAGQTSRLRSPPPTTRASRCWRPSTSSSALPAPPARRLRRFLRHPLGEHVTALFWECARRPRPTPDPVAAPRGRAGALKAVGTRTHLSPLPRLSPHPPDLLSPISALTAHALLIRHSPRSFSSLPQKPMRSGPVAVTGPEAIASTTRVSGRFCAWWGAAPRGCTTSAVWVPPAPDGLGAGSPASSMEVEAFCFAAASAAAMDR